MFAGFSAESLASRILDSKPRLVVTCTGGKRGPKVRGAGGLVREVLGSRERGAARVTPGGDVYRGQEGAEGEGAGGRLDCEGDMHRRQEGSKVKGAGASAGCEGRGRGLLVSRLVVTCTVGKKGPEVRGPGGG